ncbi:hypothetical protein N9740_04580 [Pseudomonadales bacterium]|nr:hypothetical protein [Pseudomonadales bacterium]MDB9868267.1 hypothetical protein [Pseudomonadales bacterium]MDB9943119.1 hypothetical protein [Pseudomonadales bacterium]MDC0175192.1 hypothetical protein [Pseudomonadales bacterium]
MIPHADQALNLLARRLTTALVPDLKSDYAQADGMLTGQLMTVLAAELGYGIERRMQDVRAMQELFVAAALQLSDEPLAQSLVQLSRLKPMSLTLKDVDAAHDELTVALLALHERVDLPAPEADRDKLQAINAMIWAYLESHAARHQIPD